MANFAEHLLWGLGSGIVLAKAGLQARHIDPPEGAGILMLAMIGASIPDIDYGRITAENSENPAETRESKPFRYFTFFLSVGISILCFYYVNALIRLTGDEILSIPNMSVFIILCLIVSMTVRFLIKKVTVHRGVMHSIPFAMLCAELTFLLVIYNYQLLTSFRSVSVKMPGYFAAAVFIGYLSHLITDEFHSIRWAEGRLTRTRYFGTAFTMYTKGSPIANFMLYCLVVMFLFINLSVYSNTVVTPSSEEKNNSLLIAPLIDP